MHRYAMRQYLELFHIIANKEVLIDQTIKLFDISLTTMTTDLSILSEMACCYGIRLFYDNAKITFSIEDAELYNAVYIDCTAFYARNIHNPQNLTMRVEYIGKRLLTASRYVTIDEIAEEMGYSRSNLRDDLNYVRELLESYHITVKSIPRHGVVAEGKEIDRRNCLVALYTEAGTRIILDEMDESFSYIQYNAECRAISAVLNRILKENGLVFDLGIKNHIRNYLIVQKNRVANQKYIDWLPADHNNLKELVNSLEFKAAEEILQTLKIELPEYAEMEVASLAIMLQVNEDYSLRYYRRELPESVYDQTKRFYQHIINFLQENWSITIEGNELCEALFLGLLVIVIKGRYHQTDNMKIAYFGPAKTYLYHPIVAAIATEIVQNLQQFLHAKIDDSQCYDLSKVVYHALQEADFSYRPKKIAIALGQANIYARIYERYLRQRLNPALYECIDVKRHTDIVNKRLNEYDIILTDNDYISRGAKHKGYFLIDESLPSLDLNKIQKLLEDHVVTTNIAPENIHSVKSKATCIEELYTELYEHVQTLGISDITDETEWKDHLIGHYPKTILFVVHTQHSYGGTLILGKLIRPCRMERQKIENYILAIIAPSAIRNRYYDILLHRLIHDADSFNQLYLSPDILCADALVFQE